MEKKENPASCLVACSVLLLSVGCYGEQDVTAAVTFRTSLHPPLGFTETDILYQPEFQPSGKTADGFSYSSIRRAVWEIF
ncbi:MAG: hypothetical protein V1775_16975 [Bacteroidota bacterium]